MLPILLRQKLAPAAYLKLCNACYRSVLQTRLCNGPEDGPVVHEAAVPATVAELPLTLGDARLGASTHARHVVRVQLTELRLTRR